LLYIAFLANLEHLILSLGLVFKWISTPWGWRILLERCRRSPISNHSAMRERMLLDPYKRFLFLQEYGHRFGENIHFRLPSGQLLLVHLKVIKRATCSRVFLSKVGKMLFMFLDWREVTISSFPLGHIQNFTCMSLMESEESRRKTRFGAKNTYNQMQF
jgi:hypothetical protein